MSDRQLPPLLPQNGGQERAELPPSGKMAALPLSKQGKCIRCRIRWTWRGKPRLSDAYCPDCGGKLYQTSHRLRWPVREQQAKTREAVAL